MTVKRITLLKPGGWAWMVTPEGAVPETFWVHLEAEAIRDVTGEDGRRAYIEVSTMVGPVRVLPGHYLIETDNQQVFGMVPEMYPQVWLEVQ